MKSGGEKAGRNYLDFFLEWKLRSINFGVPKGNKLKDPPLP